MDISERSVALVYEGLSPSKIAHELKISTREVIDQLSAAVNAGRIRRADVLLTLSKELRDRIELCLEVHPNFNGKPEIILNFLASAYSEYKSVTDADEIGLYLTYRQKHVHVGDMYQLLSELERTMHSKIKSILIEKFGKGDSGWWANGIPEPVRLDCVRSREITLTLYLIDHGEREVQLDCERSRELASEFDENSYNYTTLIHLIDILSKNWLLFDCRLPDDAAREKRALLKDLKRLNGIRNQVMHPVRGEPPTEDDYVFVKEMHEKLRLSHWR